MKATGNLIGNRLVRLDRQVQKELLVLKFLRQHIWSTQDILQQIMSLQSRQAAHKALTKMEKKGFLRRHRYDALGGCLTIWGITHQGQSVAFDLETENIVSACFEPNRISEQKIRHQLDLQKLRLAAEANGWTNWIDGDRLGVGDKNKKRPDAIATDPENQSVALECERTFKSIKRYQEILVNYLMLIKSEQIRAVIWILPTKEMSQRLRKILTSISDVRVHGQKVLIEPEKHHRHLYFCSYQEWPNYPSKQELNDD